MIIIMILATISFLFFSFLYLSAGNDICGVMIQCIIEAEEEKLKNTEIEMQILANDVKEKNALNDKHYMKKAKKLKNKHNAIVKKLNTFKKRKIIGYDLVPVAGYRLIKMLKWDIRNKNIKKMYDKCLRFKERKEAINYTYYVYANLYGNILLGITIGLFTIAFLMVLGKEDTGILIGVGTFIIVSIMGYLPYDEVSSIIKKREEEIEKDFLQVVSQMTLLVVAGMEVSKAWNLSSRGGRSTLYKEMNRVILDLEHNVLPQEAFGKFITRCNNKYTTRLATAIIQNMSKGNSEIVKLFTQLNFESWSEYKHSARRMSDKVQAKLFLPTMLMFLGILVMVLLPIVGGFR